MSRSILYYPSMDIEDGIWLRNAILYWDKIHSIVPNQIDADYSPEVMELEERGLYSSLTPDELFYSDAHEIFSNEVIHKIRGLNPNYRKNKKMGMKNLQIPQIVELLNSSKEMTEVYAAGSSKKDGECYCNEHMLEKENFLKIT